MTATPPDPFAVGRFVRHVQLVFERLDGENAGKMRISSPQARGAAEVVRPHPDALYYAILKMFNEATIAGYAAWQGDLYDQDELTALDDPTEPARSSRVDAEQLAARARSRTVVSWSRHSVSRPDLARLEDWTPLPDGRWMAPKGKPYSGDADQVKRMLRKRAMAGLPVTYEEHAARLGSDEHTEDTP
jgi:hypothetical protein